MTMGDRISVMHNGVLEQDGDPASLYEAPANRFVASFIGRPGMSFVETAASRVNGVYRLNRASVTLEASGARELAPTTLVGPRPEGVRLWGERPGLLGPFESVVKFVEAFGRETFLGGELVDDSQFTILVEGRTPVAIGEDVGFGVQPGQLYIFDVHDDSFICRL